MQLGTPKKRVMTAGDDIGQDGTKKPRREKKAMLPRADVSLGLTHRNCRTADKSHLLPQPTPAKREKAKQARTTGKNDSKGKIFPTARPRSRRKSPSKQNATPRTLSVVTKSSHFVKEPIHVDWLDCICGTDLEPRNPELGVQCDTCRHWFHSVCIG